MQKLHAATHGLSDVQFQQILSIMNGNDATQTTSQTNAPQANVAGTSSGLPSVPQRFCRWIIDSGATDHITSSPNSLTH